MDQKYEALRFDYEFKYRLLHDKLNPQQKEDLKRRQNDQNIPFLEQNLDQINSDFK